MANDTFSDGIAAAQAGRRQEAARIFGGIVRQEPKHVEAWLWLEDCLDDPQRKQDCLSWVLQLDPANETAAARLAALKAGGSPTPEAGSTPALTAVTPVEALDHLVVLPEAAPGKAATHEPEAPGEQICWRCGQVNPADYIYCANCRAILAQGPKITN
jgi:hypothetical protein